MTQRRVAVLTGVCLVLAAILWAASWIYHSTAAPRDRAAGLARARLALAHDLMDVGLELGSAIFIRIFKDTRELEVWLQESTNRPWVHFRTYPICNYSGKLGPKLREGDRQSPEGLYEIRADQLHPTSRFHLAFNLGFPNAFDRQNGRTGSYLMVHGDCVSIGCYAMTDRGIEEIYALAEAALDNGQSAFWVHAFPARLTDRWIAAQKGSRWIDFWRDLKNCYDLFETNRLPPTSHIIGKRYRCRSPNENRLDDRASFDEAAKLPKA